MKMISYQIGLIIVFWVSQSCKPELNINPQAYESKIIVECMLYPGQLPRLFLYRSQPFIGQEINEEEEFIKDAFITIGGNGNVDTLKTTSKLNLYTCKTDFFYEGNFAANLGTEYILTIEIGEDKLEVSTNSGLSSVAIDSVYYAKEFLDVFSEKQGLVLNFTDKKEEVNFYRMQIVHSLSNSKSTNNTDCASGLNYLANEVGKSIYSDQGADGEKALIVMEPNIEYEIGDTVYVSLQTLDPVAAGFYAQLEKQDASIKNPFVEHVFLENRFDNDNFIGIFGAANVSDPVMFVIPDL